MELILLSSRHLSLGVFFSCNISWVGTLEGDIFDVRICYEPSIYFYFVYPFYSQVFMKS